MAFITAETRSDLIELSVAMLKQAPSAALLEELIALSVDGGTLADAAEHIAKTDAFKAEYPSFQTAEQYAAEIFDNITTGGTVTADIRTAVIELATGMLTSGSVTKAGLALAIAEYLAAPAALLNTDFADIAQSFQNRADAAEYFVVTKELGGSTDAELAAAIASVTSDAATLTAANTAADATASAEAVVAGQTFTLTTGLDVASDFAATSADDTFVALDVDPAAGTADASTFNTGDDLDGGEGTDTLVIRASLDTAAHTNGASVSTANIENLSIYNNTNNDAYDVDASLMAGVTDVFVNGGNATTTVSGLDSTPNLHLISTNEAATVTFADATVGAGTADAVTILANRVATSSPVTATYARAETINLVAAGTTGSLTATTDRSLTISAADLETLNVSGDADIYVTTTFSGATAVTQTATFDASAAGGKVTASLTKGTSDLVSITMSGQDDYLAYNSALSEDAIIDGGEGVDTLELGASLSYGLTALTQTAGTGVSGFEVLRLADTVTVDARAFVNNEGLTTVIAEGAGSYTKSGITSLTQLASGAFTASLATDGAADALAVTLGGAGAGVVSTLTAADMESIAFTSAGLGTNEIEMTATGSLDLTSVTVVGTTSAIVDVAGLKLATVDASGLSGLGRTFTLQASESEADMTVTGSEVVATAAANVADTITTGEGDDTITTGANRDIISAGDGDNVIDAGDGNNTITVGRDDNTITAGDGNNTITADNGDNTITVGGIATSVNSITVGNGDNTITSGAGVDTVTLGTGDDSVDTGAGADKIYMGGYDDDDVINGGAGTDTLSASLLSTSAELLAAGLQIQPVANYVNINIGATRTATPQISGVENVYLDVILDASNDEDTASTNETLDFATTSGITNLYLNVDDDGATELAKLTLSGVDASAIHLTDVGAGSELGELVIAGAGQSSLTVKGLAMDGGTDLTVSDVDALTLTSYKATATTAAGPSIFGDIEADDADSVSVVMAAGTAALGGVALVAEDLSADNATSISINAGAFNDISLNDVTSDSGSLDSLTLTVGEESDLDIDSITVTDADMSTLTIDVGVGGNLDNNGAPVVITLADTVDAATVTVGAGATLRADFVYGGTTTLTASFSSTVDIANIGATGETASFTISGRATTNAAVTVVGETTYNFSGLVTTTAVTVTATDASDKTIIGNNIANTINTGNGADSVTGGSLIDTISTGAGDDTITGGADADEIDAGTGADVVDGGTGVDTYAVSDGDSVVDTGTAVTATAAGIDTVTVTTGDLFHFADRAEVIPQAAAVPVALADNTDDSTVTELLAAIDAALPGTPAAQDVFYVYVTDSGTGGTNSWTGGYLVSLLDGVASANDSLIKIVGSGVDANSTIALATGEVAFTV